jgi:hypothetical protein
MKLLNIDKFIEEHRIKEVTSVKRYANLRGDLDPQGLYSEEIFGRLGSKQRRLTFGYISLKLKVINPVVYRMVTSISSDLKKYINGVEKYLIDEHGNLVVDSAGETGVYYFIKNYQFINFDNMIEISHHPENISFIKKNNIFIDKIIVLPAGVRDIQENKTSGLRVFENSEISDLYEKLLLQTRNIVGDIDLLPESILETNTLLIQKTVLDISEWFKKSLKGKFGVLRSGLLSKRVDFSGRENIIPDDMLSLGYIGIPLNHVLKYFEPFFYYHVLNIETSLQDDIKEYMNVNDPNIKVDTKLIRNFVTTIYNNPYSLKGEFYNKIKRAAEIIVKDRNIIYKRDPTESRDTWVACYVRVDDIGYAVRINPLDLNRNGGDFDGDAVSVFSLLTEEAQEQAKKYMNPKHAKSTWLRSNTLNSLVYDINHDAMIGLYMATEV